MDIKPFIYQTEANAARLERTIQRLWIVLIITILMLVTTNGVWIWYELQFEETVTYTQEADIDTGSGNTIFNNGGDMNYGEGQSKTNNN